MKSDHDSQLLAVLRAWQVSPPPAPGFQSAVRRRIAARQKHTVAGMGETLREWLFVQLPRPVYAAALLTLTVVVGVTAAHLRVGRLREEYRLASARQYLAAIDPMAMTANASRATR